MEEYKDNFADQMLESILDNLSETNSNTFLAYQFGALHGWLSSGGELPREWQRKND